MVVELFSVSNPIFASYAFYAAVVILKMLALGPLTSVKRMAKGVFANPEDVKGFGGKKIILDDPDVERVRKNHLNDVENIPAFLFLGLLYVAIQPSFNAAVWHFRIFAISRIFHMFAYQLALPQPSRAGAYTVGLLVCVSMAVQVLMKV